MCYLAEDFLPGLFWIVCEEVGIFRAQPKHTKRANLGDVRGGLDVHGLLVNPLFDG